MNWHLQDAKNSLSRVVRMAQESGPQTITLRGQPAAVVLSARDYAALTRDRPSLVDMLVDQPNWDDALAEQVSSRQYSASRDVDL